MLYAAEIPDAMIWSVGAALVGAVVTIAKLLHGMMAKQLESIKAERDEYKKKAELSIAGWEAVIAKVAEERGVTLAAKLAPVVAEHRSPTTEKQQETADLGTAQARLVAVNLSTKELFGIDPVKEETAVQDEKAAATAAAAGPVTSEQVEDLKQELTKAPDAIADKVAEKVVEKLGGT